MGRPSPRKRLFRYNTLTGFRTIASAMRALINGTRRDTKTGAEAPVAFFRSCEATAQAVAGLSVPVAAASVSGASTLPRGPTQAPTHLRCHRNRQPSTMAANRA